MNVLISVQNNDEKAVCPLANSFFYKTAIVKIYDTIIKNVGNRGFCSIQILLNPSWHANCDICGYDSYITAYITCHYLGKTYC